MTKTFKFDGVVNFEITVAEAAQILSIQDNGQSMAEWLGTHLPSPDNSEHYCREQMRTALGQHLAQQRVEEARQLTMPADATVTQEPQP
jgi:hypothetical protein